MKEIHKNRPGRENRRRPRDARENPAPAEDEALEEDRGWQKQGQQDDRGEDRLASEREDFRVSLDQNAPGLARGAAHPLPIAGRQRLLGLGDLGAAPLDRRGRGTVEDAEPLEIGLPILREGLHLAGDGERGVGHGEIGLPPSGSDPVTPALAGVGIGGIHVAHQQHVEAVLVRDENPPAPALGHEEQVGQHIPLGIIDAGGDVGVVLRLAVEHRIDDGHLLPPLFAADRLVADRVGAREKTGGDTRGS
jgi:hypothetical protein